MRRAWADQTSCSVGGPPRTTGQMEEINADENAGGKANAVQKPLQPSEELTAVVGSAPLPRGQVVSKIWEYMRSHNMQNMDNGREILADDKLRRVLGKDKVTIVDM